MNASNQHFERRAQATRTNTSTEAWQEGYGLACPFRMNFRCEVSPKREHYESPVTDHSSETIVCCLAWYFNQRWPLFIVIFYSTNIYFMKLQEIQGTEHFRVIKHLHLACLLAFFLFIYIYISGLCHQVVFLLTALYNMVRCNVFPLRL